MTVPPRGGEFFAGGGFEVMPLFPQRTLLTRKLTHVHRERMRDRQTNEHTSRRQTSAGQEHERDPRRSSAFSETDSYNDRH